MSQEPQSPAREPEGEWTEDDLRRLIGSGVRSRYWQGQELRRLSGLLNEIRAVELQLKRSGATVGLGEHLARWKEENRDRLRSEFLLESEPFGFGSNEVRLKADVELLITASEAAARLPEAALLPLLLKDLEFALDRNRFRIEVLGDVQASVESELPEPAPISEFVPALRDEQSDFIVFHGVRELSPKSFILDYCIYYRGEDGWPTSETHRKGQPVHPYGGPAGLLLPYLRLKHFEPDRRDDRGPYSAKMVKQLNDAEYLRIQALLENAKADADKYPSSNDLNDRVAYYEFAAGKYVPWYRSHGLEEPTPGPGDTGQVDEIVRSQAREAEEARMLLLAYDRRNRQCWALWKVAQEQGHSGALATIRAAADLLTTRYGNKYGTETENTFRGKSGAWELIREKLEYKDDHITRDRLLPLLHQVIKERGLEEFIKLEELPTVGGSGD